MEEKEFAEAWESHLDYLAKHPPFCGFCGKHHLDLENCIP